MNSKRSSAVPVFFMALCLLPVIGCAKKPAVEGVVKPVEIKVAYWGAPDEVNIISGIISRWQAVRPDIVVRLEHTPYRGYADKLLTRIAGRAAPDIICTEVDLFVTFQSKDVLLDLNPYLQKDPEFKITDFFPEIIDRFTVGGKLYAVPRDTAPFACVYYNKKLFDEAGVPYPSDDWTLADMLEKAKRLTMRDRNGSVVQYGFYAWAWQNFVYAFGGSLVDDVKKPTRCALDSPKAVKGLQYYSDLINVYKVQPSSITMSNLAMGVQGMFMTGRLAMFSSGIWETPGLRKIADFDWDVAMFPKGPSGIRGFGTGGSGYCILKESAHPKEAFEVIKALAGKSAQEAMAQAGLVQPAMKPIAESDLWTGDGKPPKNKNMLNEAMRHVVYDPFSPSWREAKELYIIPELDLTFGGRKTAEEAAGAFVPKVNDLLRGKKVF